MGKANISGVFNAPIKKVFDTISDFSSYPEFLSDVKRVSIIDASNPEKKLVEMEIEIIKSFRYQIWVYEKPITDLWWNFHSGDLFKENSGAWKLKDLGGDKTGVEYELSAKFGLFVPGMIEKKLIGVTLPNMLESYKKRVESL